MKQIHLRKLKKVILVFDSPARPFILYSFFRLTRYDHLKHRRTVQKDWTFGDIKWDYRMRSEYSMRVSLTGYGKKGVRGDYKLVVERTRRGNEADLVVRISLYRLGEGAKERIIVMPWF